MARRRLIAEISGRGAGFAIIGVAACLVMGALLPPLRGSVGLANVAIAHLGVVIVVAAIGGRGAAMLTALYAALNYNFFFTTPYYTLRIDSAEQVITVALLFVAGFVAGLAGRSSRRVALAAREEAAAIGLLNGVTQAIAEGADADQAAAEGLRELLRARAVQVWRAGLHGDLLTASAGRSDGPVPPAGLPRLDAAGRVPRGYLRMVGDTLVLPAGGVEVELVRQGRRVGALVVLPEPDRHIERATRVAVATTAHVLAVADPMVSA